MNCTASQTATELRKLADALDREPDTVIPKPNIYFSCSYQGDKSKPLFLSLAHILPRPIRKVFKNDEVRLESESEGLDLISYVERSKVCEIVEPAKPAVYNCIPLLSVEEEKALGEF